MKYLTLLILCLSTFYARAAERVTYTVNEVWSFSRQAVSAQDDQACWTTVDIPHSWNISDSQDETPGMYRGSAWYKKTIRIPAEFSGRRAVIYFEGANQTAEVYVNGSFVGRHIGGYTRFCFDITELLNFGGENLLAVKVDNSHNPDIPPLSADFTFFGGIYRDVYLKFLNPIHISTDDYASSGVYIRTPKVSAESAVVNITTLITNATGTTANVRVESEITDASGARVALSQGNAKVPAGERLTFASEDIALRAPRLWDIDDPYLYLVHVRVKDRKSGEVIDEVSEPLGLRWFSFDADEGFFLNGRHRKLVGTSRHQDFMDRGNALRDEFHVQDVMLHKKMGGNFLRVSHYPQDPTVMDMCDKLGIVTSVEIPVVNEITESEAFLENALDMVTEMVRQDFNRPSVVIWAYMNEVLLRQPYPDGDSVDLPRYYDAVYRVAKALDDRVRAEDGSRYTMMAYHNAQPRYDAARLTSIPMILGWNLYQGWYEPDINEFQALLDKFHADYPDKPLLVTEFGPGVDVRLHSYSPERFDFTQEYGLVYHRHYLREILKRPFIAGANLWNLNDFYSEPRTDTNPHVNNKGVLSLEREPKDVYLFYSAALSREPYLAIGQRYWKSRGGVLDAGTGVCRQTVPVFSNLEELEFFVDGVSLGRKAVEDGCVFFEVGFVPGENVLEVVGFGSDSGSGSGPGFGPGTGSVSDRGPGSDSGSGSGDSGIVLKDRLVVDFQGVPECLGEDFLQLNVMLGSHRYFDDRLSGLSWIPEQEYHPGSWGYIGGEPYRRPSNFGTMLGTHIDILGTDEDPIFQTQRRGLEAFKADVPDGQYAVYLYFAELDQKTTGEALAYNLGSDAASVSTASRSFDLSLNGRQVLTDFNLERDCGAGRGVIKKFIVEATDGQGLTVGFTPIQGESVLNAIRIYRIY